MSAREPTSKLINQVRRLPHEIAQARARGNEDQAARSQRSLDRAREALASRGRR